MQAWRRIDNYPLQYCKSDDVNVDGATEENNGKRDQLEDNLEASDNNCGDEFGK